MRPRGLASAGRRCCTYCCSSRGAARVSSWTAAAGPPCCRARPWPRRAGAGGVCRGSGRGLFTGGNHRRLACPLLIGPLVGLLVGLVRICCVLLAHAPMGLPGCQACQRPCPHLHTTAKEFHIGPPHHLISSHVPAKRRMQRCQQATRSLPPVPANAATAALNTTGATTTLQNHIVTPVSPCVTLALPAHLSDLMRRALETWPRRPSSPLFASAFDVSTASPQSRV